MQRRDLFSVLVKAMGLWEAVVGLEMLPSQLATVGEYHDDKQFFLIVLATAFSYSGSRIIVGLALFFGADWLTGKVYPAPTVAE
ncbi:MAG: hypothetical protein AB7O59_12795 [Pirellulales bacterium]